MPVLPLGACHALCRAVADSWVPESVCDAAEGTVCPRTAWSARLAEFAFRSSSSLKVLASKTSVTQNQMQNQPFVHTTLSRRCASRGTLAGFRSSPLYQYRLRDNGVESREGFGGVGI